MTFRPENDELPGFNEIRDFFKSDEFQKKAKEVLSKHVASFQSDFPKTQKDNAIYRGVK